MVEEAPLIPAAGGLVPEGPGWFVVNARAARWKQHPKFGWFTDFEGEGAAKFQGLGFNLAVIEPGQPSAHYHSESVEEVFLVLKGQARLLVEGQERLLGPLDFFYCAPFTEHIFVGAGEEPCLIAMVGVRSKDNQLRYPRSDLALKYNAGSPVDTDQPSVSYAGCGKSDPCAYAETPRALDRLGS